MDAQLQEKLKAAKAKIISNSKDAHFASALIDELIGLQKQADVEAVELIVPCSEVEHIRQIDDVTVLIKTLRGYLYKHGQMSYVYVPYGENSLYEAMVEFDELLGKSDRNDDENLTIAMIVRMLEWHTVAFYDAEALIGSATAANDIIKGIVDRATAMISEMESEADIKENAEFEKSRKAIEELIHTPIPDLD